MFFRDFKHTKLLAATLIVVVLLSVPFFFNTNSVTAASQWVNVTIDNTKVAGDLTDFPVYIDLSDLPAAFWDTTNCTDIRAFKSDGTTELPREIVSCTDNGSTGTGELHVKYTGTLSSTTDTVIQIHYDGTSSDYATTATYGRNAVWSDYEGVWHLHDGAGLSYVDSSGTQGDGSVDLGTPGTETVAFSTGVSFDGSTSIYLGTDNGFVNGSQSEMTYSMWVSPDNDLADLGTVGHINGERSSSGNIIYVDAVGSESGHPRISSEIGNVTEGHQVGAAWSDGDPIYNVLRWDDTAKERYLDTFITATPVQTLTDETGNSLAGGTEAVYLGGRFDSETTYWGGINEVRFTGLVRSDDWIATEYNNQSSPSTFYSVSGEQTGGGGGGESVNYQVRSSTNYQLQSDSINFGGGLSTSSNYELESTAGEIATGLSTSSSYSLKAGYQQMQEVFISITTPDSVTMSPSIGGITGGTSNGTTSVSVVTDSPSGYQLTIKAEGNPAMQKGVDTISDYAPVASPDPDFSFTTNSNDAHFGFSPAGNDITQRWLDDSSDCNTGSNNTALSCWDGLSTSDKTIAQGSANYPGGATTTLHFRVGIGGGTVVTAGVYTATSTVTALPL